MLTEKLWLLASRLPSSRKWPLTINLTHLRLVKQIQPYYWLYTSIHFVLLHSIWLFVFSALPWTPVSEMVLKGSESNINLCSIGHVSNIPTMQFSLEFPEILSQNLIAIIDWVWLGIPKVCLVGYSLTWVALGFPVGKSIVGMVRGEKHNVMIRSGFIT